MYNGRGGGSCLHWLDIQLIMVCINNHQNYVTKQSTCKMHMKPSPWSLWPFLWLHGETPLLVNSKKADKSLNAYHFPPKMQLLKHSSLTRWWWYDNMSSTIEHIIMATLTVTHWIQECKLQTGSLLAWVSLCEE